jgi:ATP-dependent exoDNAse (exonuclease V) beta subunit
MLSLSQGQLNLFETCPRKFQYMALDALSVPMTPDQRESTDWGSRFHRLMQQHTLGLPIEVMREADPLMTQSMAALRQSAPELFADTIAPSMGQSIGQSMGQPQYLSEHQRTLAFNDYLLTVVYDLLILAPDQAQIVDWKTHLRPPDRQRLAKDWQTRLYLYVLKETSQINDPTQLSVTYWFVRHQDPKTQTLTPSFYRFAYSQKQHRQTEKDLLRLTQAMTTLRAKQSELAPTQPADFPMVDLSAGHCDLCPFAMRCQRFRVSESLNLLEIESIAEVEL